MSEEQLKEALRALADHDRAEEAPPFIEARVLAEFRARRRRTLWPLVTGAIGLAAAASIVAIALWPSEPAPAREIAAPIEVAPQPQDVFIEELPAPPPPIRRVRPKALAAATMADPPTDPREVVTEFFPLMDVMPPIEYGQVYRVSVPASTMRVMGVPVRREMWNQRVEAEVLVGEEGLARAIRFVGYEQ